MLFGIRKMESGKVETSRINDFVGHLSTFFFRPLAAQNSVCVLACCAVWQGNRKPPRFLVSEEPTSPWKGARSP